MAFGLLSSGFVPEPLAQVNADILAALQAQFGADIDTSATGPFGLLAGILADREATLWQLAQAVYGAAYPDTASGAQLADLGALTGAVPLGASKGSLSAVLLGTNATVVPAATFQTPGSAVQFQTIASATIATLAGWVTATTYPVGALCTNAGNVYSCAVAIASSAAAPTGTGTAIADGSGFWRYCGAGTAAVAAPCNAVLTGPLLAPAGTLTVIATPVAGLGSVVNPLDAVPGTNAETDAAFRLRRLALLAAQGKSPVASIRAGLLAPSLLVAAAQVYENTADVADGVGRPPHSVEAVVQGGTDAAVALAVWQNKAAGIATFGTSTQNVTDASTGVVYAVNFTRPGALPIYVAVALKKTASYGAGVQATGDAQVQAAIVSWANGLVAEPTGGVPVAVTMGQTIYASPLAAAILDQVVGVADVTSVFIGTAPAPGTSTPIAATYSQLPGFDTTRISVVST